MSDDKSLIAIPIKASAGYTVSKEEKKVITDHRNFPHAPIRLKNLEFLGGVNF